MVFNKKHGKSFRNFLVPPSRRGQGLSLTTIIVAVLALIVLVLLVAILSGRIAIFEKGVTAESKTELVKMKISFGDCQPLPRMEQDFLADLSQAENIEAKETAKANFQEEIDRCKLLSPDKDNCEQADCKWS